MLILLQAFVGTPPLEAAVSEDEVRRLVEEARRGRRAAAARLYELHVRRLYRAVRPLCAGPAEAEDAVQEAFARAFAALGRWRPRRSATFAGWLVTIALNEARRTRHRQARFELRPPEELDGPDNAGVVPGLAEETAARRATALLAALAELPERDRRVLVLRYGAELAAAEVGRIEGLSAANVRKICERQRRRLLERLRELLGPDEPPDPGGD